MTVRSCFPLLAVLLPLYGCDPNGVQVPVESPAASNATPPADFVLCDVNDIEHRPFAQPGTRALALIFIVTDCPIANSYAPEIRRLCADYSGRGVAFCLVQVDPDLTAQEARKHAHEYGHTCPVALDPHHALVRRAGVTRVPEAAVFAADGSRVYRGRIDDRFLDYARPRPEPTSRDLRDALQAVLAGRTVAHPETEAVGCYIPGLSTQKDQP